MNILYIGHVGQQTGYGRSATDFCRALLRVGASVKVLPISREAHLPADLEPHRAPWGHAFYDVAIVHTLPIHCANAWAIARPEYGGARKIIAYTTWETLTMPESIAREIALFDEIWTPSRASQQAIAKHAGAYTPDKFANESDWQLENVHVIPHCFDPFDDNIRRALDHGGERPGYPQHGGRVRFYWIGAWNARKNPQGVLKAFAHIFGKSDDIELVMQSTGADPIHQCYASLAQTALSQSELAPISFQTNPLSDEQLWQMHMQSDVFVCASRGEAWNLPAFEAMLAGKIVIAPEHLGSDDFLYMHEDDDGADRRTNALTYRSHTDIAWDTVRSVSTDGNQVGFKTTGVPGLTSKCLWQEPDLVTLSLEMHHAAYNMVRRGTHGEMYYDPIKAFGYETVGNLMLERIRQ